MPTAAELNKLKVDELKKLLNQKLLKEKRLSAQEHVGLLQE